MMKESTKVLMVGTIKFSDYESFTEDVGYMGSVNIGPLYGVYVWADEGNVPHFHISKTPTSPGICVCIYSNQYFKHGIHQGELKNNNQKKILDTWLDATIVVPHPTKPKLIRTTNWKHIRYVWNDANPDCLFPQELKCKEKPDYTTMCTTYNPNLT